MVHCTVLPAARRAARSYGLCVLYDIATRVSEICSLRIEDVRFENPPHIRIMGKGMKVRAVPILPATAKNEKKTQPMGNWLRGN
ncbi:tyrosine-type recombinase/integrase [Gemmiger qucibialis]|uniref:tyrosine-type recombinase/integrase n=1 Tax=Gemmiger qucibialis TaxID=2997294 RepID=UPI0022E9025B|nr:tyrosine-type recombinase/integrase [Gemmiger qucibialis]